MNPEYKYVYRNGKRYYEIDGKLYIGVTSVTKAVSIFKDSKTAGPSAKIGSLAHAHILKNYSTELFELPNEVIYGVSDEDITKKINSALRMWKNLDFKFKFKDVETLILNKDLKYAGRTDFTGWDADEIYSVGDIKTGAYYKKEYDMQIAAYCKALNAKRGYIVQIDLNTREDRNPDQTGKLIVMNESDINKAFDEFLVLLNQFNF